MRWLLLFLLLLPLRLVAEPMQHPVTNEEGFWISVPQMQETVIALRERDFYRSEYETCLISNETLSANQDSLKIKLKTRAFLIGGEGLMLAIMVVLFAIRTP